MQALPAIPEPRRAVNGVQMDSLFNLVIILIPLAIFIGRAVTKARAKNKPPPPPAPHIPVFFEDDEDEESTGEIGHWVADRVKEVPAAPAARSLQSQALSSQKTKSLVTPGLAEISATRGDKSIKAPKKALPSTAKPTAAPAAKPAAVAGQGLVNLNHLSPLKQAVVMAEVLGPPKGLQ